MADTKVSGLSAVAAFATTQEFPVNDSGTSRKITGTQLIAAVAQGTLPSGYAQVTANQSGISAEVDLTGLTVTVTVGTGRRIKITAFCRLQQNTGQAAPIVNIKEGATQLGQYTELSGTSGGAITVSFSVILTPTAASHTYKLTCLTASNTVDMLATATNPAYILVEDIGV